MSTIISVGTTSGTAFNVSPDTSGQLVVQTNGTTTALTLTTAQNAVFAGSVNATNTFAFKNRLIDAGFIINQRAYTSGTSLSSGTYGHDRWKGGAGGGTYTFTQGSAGVPITITITAGTIQQVIEGSNVAEGGTYTLSWTGTATARINSGSYLSSPITVTGQTAGSNMTIEFATGTVLKPQLETGSIATSFDFRNYTAETTFCQRYYWQASSSNGCFSGVFGGGPNARVSVQYPVLMRTSPTITWISGGSVQDNSGHSANVNGFSTAASIGNINASIQLSLDANGYSSAGAVVYNMIFSASAEL
jgi:hypothetical protein